jgi:hypothetical protein
MGKPLFNGIPVRFKSLGEEQEIPVSDWQIPHIA